jgi:hypothetical protein
MALYATAAPGGLEASPAYAFAITTSNTVDLPHATTGIWVGVTGAIKVDMVGDGTGNGGTVTFSAVPVGWFVVRATRVYATGTTATTLIGGYN